MTSPINPPPAIIAPAKSDSMPVNGVKKRMKYATTMVVIKPPMNPSHVLLGLIFSIILCLPNNLPHVNWNTSFISVKNTTKSNNPLPPALNPDNSGRDNKYAKWLMENTVNISCTGNTLIDRPISTVKPRITKTKGIQMNIITGIKMMNKLKYPI